MTVAEQEIKEFYKQLAPEVLASYDKINTFARDIGSTVASPELVFLGLQGVKKSAALEAVLGFPCTYKEGGFHRPVFLQLSYSPSCADIKVTIKRDSLLREQYGSDVQIPVQNLGKELAVRDSLQPTAVPIYVLIEWKSHPTMTLIDTPGLSPSPSLGITDIRKDSVKNIQELVAKDKDGGRERIALEQARPPHRHLFFVSSSPSSSQWDTLDIIEYARRIDSKLSRTVFLFNDLHKQLHDITTSKELTQYLSKKPSDAKVFFFSLPDVNGEREMNSFRENVVKFSMTDQAALHTMQSDKKGPAFVVSSFLPSRYCFLRLDDIFHISSVRNYIYDYQYKYVKDSISEQRRTLTNIKKTNADNIQRIQNQIQALELHKLRSLTSNYVADWVHVVRELMEGSTEANPAMNGQTLEEEIESLGEWLDENGKILSVSKQQTKSWDAKVYGGQQFERLLQCFGAVVKNYIKKPIVLKEVQQYHTVATLGDRHSMSDYVYVASSIVRRRIRSFLPLISQLCERACSILSRLYDLANMVMITRKDNRSRTGTTSSGAELISLYGYSYFTSLLRDIYISYVNKLTQICKEKCLEQIEQCHILLWDVNLPTPLHGVRSADEGDKLILELVNSLYDDTCDSVVENTLLTCHHHLYVLYLRDISGEVLKQVSSFDDNLMEQVFSLKKAKELLKIDEDKEKEEGKRLGQSENQLRDLTSQFAKYRLVPM